MNCKICQSKYQLSCEQKHPRVLTQCGHTFCTKCIGQLIYNEQLNCRQCGKISIGFNVQKFPINETLIAILKSNQGSQNEKIKKYELCKTHNKRLQAYCENDNQLLCLNCVLSVHKSHKVSSIVEKVSYDKQLLKQCHNKILQSKSQIQYLESTSISTIDKLNMDFNQYVFQINLLYKNIISQLRQQENNFIVNVEKQIKYQIQKIKLVQQQLKDKKQFFAQLSQIYKEVVTTDGVDYLNQNNKRIFIVQNCAFKDNFKIYSKKINLNRIQILNSAIKNLDQLVQFQKKKSKSSSQKKTINNNKASPSSNVFQKSGKKQCDVLLTISDSILQQSPSKFQKKNLIMNTSNQSNKMPKEPQILQVNLTQQYQKHQQSKQLKKRISENVSSSQNKCLKIEYEIKKEIQPTKQQQISNRPKNMQIKAKVALTKARPHQQSPIYEKILSQMSSSQLSISPSYKKQFSLSILSSESQLMSSPINFNSQRQSDQKPYQMLTPMSINSFMNSSRFTTHQKHQNTHQKDQNTHQRDQNSHQRDQTLLKDSRASFTMFCQEHKIYHFGGLQNDSITCQKLDLQNNHSSQIIYKGLNRNKCQVILLKDYSTKKCLIIGGKDSNGQRNSSIIQFDYQSKTLKKSSLFLNQAISGFGTVVKDSNKLYVFGGSTSTPQKTMYQYRLSKIGFQMKKMASMISSRDQLGFAMGFDGFLYACGGINTSNSILNSCERYCFKTNKWTSISAMKYQRRSFTLVSLPNGIYAIGGHDGKSYLNSVEIFDYQTQKWVQLNPLNQGRFTHTAIATSDYQNIFVFGGYESEPLKSIQRYSVIQNKWINMFQMDNPRFLHCSYSILD